MAITLSLFAGAGAQFFDNSGVMLSGGLIYTYAAGTTTPETTYTNNIGNSALPNPIVLDATGRIPTGQIWLSYGVGYKFTVKTSTGTLIGTYDNIPSAALPPLVNDATSIAYEQGTQTNAGAFIVGQTYLITLIGTTNFQLIGAVSNTVGLYFVATGVGAGTGTAKLSRTVQAKLQETVSVKDFGAIGDNTTDDTAAIQAALTAAGATTPRSTVYIPAGSYKTTSTLTIPLGVTLTGQASAWQSGTANRFSGAIIYPNHNSKTISLIGDGSNSNSAGGGILNLNIQCNFAAYPTTTGIYIAGAQQVSLKNIVVSQAGTAAFIMGDYNAGTPLTCTYITADNLYSNTTKGIAFDICGKWHRFNQLITDGIAGPGFRLQMCEFSMFSDFHTEGTTVGGILIGNQSNNNTFIKGYVSTSGTYGVKLLNDSGTYINSFRDVYLIGNNTGTGFDLVGINNVVNYVNNCKINTFAIGVSDLGDANTLDSNLFYACGLPISCNASNSKYVFNRTQVTSGSYSISHLGGTLGIWQSNTLDKTINPAATTVAGNFSGNVVKNNIGYVSRNSGITASTIVSGGTIAHGLAGIPASYQITPATTGITAQAAVTATSATTLTVTWTGTTNVTFAWSANLLCDY